MKSVILIEAYTMSAYRAIRPAIVVAHIGYVGVCGLTFSATIYQKDYAYLVDVINIAAQSAGIPRDEYNIVALQNIAKPTKTE